uniref:immunoglobulin-like domain-containing protein n=1 Tax=Paenibacillus paridis TaxID=2583376 RepID=UPI00112038A4
MYSKRLQKMTVMLIMVSLITSMFLTMGTPNSVYAEEDTTLFAGGEGTLENPFKIATADNLRNVSIPGPGAYFQQVANIGLTGNWTPIGSFSGIYDGASFTIENLTISSPDSFIGLFSNITSGAVLENMRLESFNITATGDNAFVGGLVGIINAGATVKNSSSNGVITITNLNIAGGLTGYNGGNVINSESTSTINSSSTSFSAGSLIGTNAATGMISGSKGSGSINAPDSYNAYLGGLVGSNGGTVSATTSSSMVTGGGAASAGGLVGSNLSGGTVNDSYSAGIVSGKGSAVVGGLIGRNAGNINRSYSTGNAHAGSQGMAGGLVGYKANGNIMNSFSWGNASGDGAVFVGGLVGMNNGGDVSYSYSTGSASGGTDANGGLIGFKQGTGTVSNSYYNNAAATSSYGGVAKSATELKRQTTFTGWDFNAIWRIAEDYTYPSLQWQPYSATEITFMDHRDLTWDSIKGANSVKEAVIEDLVLPTSGAAGSTITWSVPSGVGLIDTSTGKVTRATDDDHAVILTAAVSRSGGQTILKDFSLIILEAPNNKPIRQSNVNETANATVSVNTPYELNLSEIFEDADGDPLSYKVSVNGAQAIAADTSYTYTPISAGLVTLVFTASDEESDSDDTYTVSLRANSVPVRQADVNATDEAVVTVNTPYTLDLSTIFEDADSNTLSYKVSVDGEAATAAAAAYTFTP